MRKVKYFFVFVVGISVILTLQGCDRLSKLVDYFVPNKKSQASAPVAMPPAAKPVNANPAPAMPVVEKNMPASEIPKNVLARVGNWMITIDEFKERLNALAEVVKEYDIKNVEQNKLILEELVRQQLIVEDAEKKGIDKKKDIVQAVDEFRRTLLVREVASKLVEGIAATDQDAEEYYKNNPQEFIEPTEYRIAQILVGTEQEAKDILAQILQGADFGEMVKTKSKKAPTNDFVKDFEFPKMGEVVSTLDVGGVSSVFKGPDGFYIVKLNEKRGGKPQSFEKIRKDLKDALTGLKQQQALLEYLKQLREQTTVEVNDKLLEE